MNMEFLKESWANLADIEEEEDFIVSIFTESSKIASKMRAFYANTHKSKYKTKSRTGSS